MTMVSGRLHARIDLWGLNYYCCIVMKTRIANPSVHQPSENLLGLLLLTLG